MRELTHAQLKTVVEMRQPGLVVSVVARYCKLNPVQPKSYGKTNSTIHTVA